jgi:hypothetical protein
MTLARLPGRVRIGVRNSEPLNANTASSAKTLQESAKAWATNLIGVCYAQSCGRRGNDIREPVPITAEP